VAQRLQAVRELAAEVAEGQVGAVEAAARLDEIRDGEGSSLPGTTTRTRTGRASAREVVHGMQAVLRSVASASEVERAADTLAPAHPQLAEFLRVYGAGRTGEAIAHYEAHQD